MNSSRHWSLRILYGSSWPTGISGQHTKSILWRAKMAKNTDWKAIGSRICVAPLDHERHVPLIPDDEDWLVDPGKLSMEPGYHNAQDERR